VNSDGDREQLKQVIAAERIAWRSWWDGSTSGPISSQWQIEGWPSIFIIDSKGIIRHRPESLRADPTLLERHVQQLLNEMGK
jgi:hypothetical protein